ncbi:DUF1989 domain-containing protein, partial [Mycolicibacter algericus]|uniref:DUF1989 domain-containing protein n=1 Tax=Mycolicibacter algericus TaxID=1288388 RepID=UPI0021F2ADB7
HERLNIADTVKVPWQAYPSTGHPLLSGFGRVPSTGHPLLSGFGRVLATIVADTSTAHDALAGTTTGEGNLARYGASAPESPSPAGRELLLLGALKHGLSQRDLPPSLSFFKGVRVDVAVDLLLHVDAIVLLAVDLLLLDPRIVLLANTAHPLDPRPQFTCSPLRVHAWSADDDLGRLTELVG